MPNGKYNFNNDKKYGENEMYDFQPFVMERMMSKFEQDVDFNLSESGVHPILLKDLLGGETETINRY